jgi:phage replication-related protein YjqB (UPF0714/DUF867 family)
MPPDKYSCFKELEAAEAVGKDFSFVARPRDGTSVAVIAPHGGGIEPFTAELAEAIAGSDFSVYCFKGLKKSGNRDLHIASHKFDEPTCLMLVATHKSVLAIHGCDEEGERCLLGGRDASLICEFANALNTVGIIAETEGHNYPGKDPNNVCNRGASGAGVQFELSMPFRNGKQIPTFLEVVRTVLAKRQNAT